MRTLAKSSGVRSYMMRLAAGLAGILICTALAWAASEPWKTKPYQQWDEKDIQQILADSPWVRTVSVEAGWKSSATTPNQPSSELNSESGVGGPTTTSNPSPRMGGDAGPMPEQGQPMAQFMVFWMSSKTMRAALAQREVLHSGQTPAEAQQYVDAPQAEYQIVVQGQDMTPFLRFNEKYYETNSYLHTKKSGEKVFPTHVDYQRTPDGQSINAVIFSFAKKLPSGQPLILPQEKSIEFSCKVEGSDMKVRFEPQKMLNQNGEDL